MIAHLELGNTGLQRMRRLKYLIDHGEIQFAGNKKLKIYGTFCCPSGKRMKTENRVLFKSIEEAESNGFRPCGHCMREEYLRWKELKG